MEESVPPGSVCCFCQSSQDDEALYGKFYKLGKITTHYFCLLLSSKILQRGSDREGILGFLPKDIRDELQRGQKYSCSYCHKKGATIECYRSKCRMRFHLPCGQARNTFHQFFGEFRSFCHKHKIMQRINHEILKVMSGKQSICLICFESVPATPSPKTLWAPCCSKDAWFHRICIQRLALSAGYFFKCPLCNNTDQFVKAMRNCGIWIPEQDASWEREPGRYEGLLERHSSCDAKRCRCRQGRTFHLENTKWEIKLCADCGSQGIHVDCGNLRVSDDWVCAVCVNVTVSRDDQKESRKVSRTQQAMMARNRARRALPARPLPHITQVREKQSQKEENVKKDSSLNSEIDVCTEPSEGNSYESRKFVSSQPDPSVLSSTGIKMSVTTLSDSDVEIIDVEDNSDEDIQVLPRPNIRFIKTNAGDSVPVVEVRALQSTKKDVVVSGDPCQPPTLSADDTKLDKNTTVGISHLYQSTNSTEQSEATVSVINAGNTCSSTDDEIVVEVQRFQTNNKKRIIGMPISAWSSDEIEENKQTEMLYKISRSMSENRGLQPFGGILTIQNKILPPKSTFVFDHSISGGESVEISTPSDCHETRVTVRNHTKSVLVQDSYVPEEPLNLSFTSQTIQKQGKMPPLQAEILNSEPKVLMSLTQGAKNVPTTSSRCLRDTYGFKQFSDVDSRKLNKHTSYSKVTHLAEGNHNYTHDGFSSELTNNAACSSSIPFTQDPRILDDISWQHSCVVVSSNKPSTSTSFYSVLDEPVECPVISDNTNSFSRENICKIQNPIFSTLQNKPIQEDWSVEFVPPCNKFNTNNFTSEVVEENSGVVYAGPVTYDSFICQQNEGSSALSTDDIIIIDDGLQNSDNELLLGNERKQRNHKEHDNYQSVFASNICRIGEPRIHLPVHAGGMFAALSDPRSAVAASTGFHSQPHLTTSSQDFF